MFDAERLNVIECARSMSRYGLVVLSGGNVSVRMPDGNFLVTPSAMGYDSMEPEDIVLVNPRGGVVEGVRRPSSDLSALLYVFNHVSGINVVLHTHQAYATAVGLVCDELPANLVTVIDELHAPVRVAPFTPSSDEGMGIATVEYSGEALAVILKHHGVMAYGASLEQALSAAVYLEEASKTYLAAMATRRPIPLLSAEDIAREGAERGYYGQPKSTDPLVG
jgi:L-ribulose-5-phosphate 4-epimerase